MDNDDNMPRKRWLQLRAMDQVEDPDPTPVEVPLHMQAPPSLEERLKAFILQQLSPIAEAHGAGTFEEEDDFEMDDDSDLELLSDYQLLQMLDEEDPDAPDRNELPPVPAEQTGITPEGDTTGATAPENESDSQNVTGGTTVSLT